MVWNANIQILSGRGEVLVCAIQVTWHEAKSEVCLVSMERCHTYSRRLLLDPDKTWWHGLVPQWETPLYHIELLVLGRT